MLTESQKNGAEQAILLPNKAPQPDARYARAAELLRWADTLRFCRRGLCYWRGEFGAAVTKLGSGPDSKISARGGP